MMTAHMINVAQGEDVIRRIMLFARGQPYTVVLSCFGAVSIVSMRTSRSAEAVTYEGPFDILTLSGTYGSVNAPHAPVGSLSVSLVGPDGHVRGGVFEDVMVAARPVQIVLGTLFLKPKTTTWKGPETSAGPADRAVGDSGTPLGA